MDLVEEMDFESDESSSSSSSGSTFILQHVLDSDFSSDDDEERKHGGSRVGRSQNKPRDFLEHYVNLRNQYFNGDSVYSENDFVRRFRMKRCIFDEIRENVEKDNLFQWKMDCTGKMGIHPLVKLAAVLRVLGYGTPFDQMDELFGISESMVAKCFHRFNELMVDLYASKYLALPSEEELKEKMKVNASRGFPGCIGSIDCTVIKWHNCPVAFKGQYCGPKTKVPTVQLETVVDADLYIWHQFFGMPGSCNDINVLDNSPLMHKIENGQFPPPLQYEIEGERFTTPYMLADGIYPDWAVFAKPIGSPITMAEKAYTKKQESIRKDVERAYGILKIRFRCLDIPVKLWHIEKMKKMVQTCIILHNMIIATRNQDVLSASLSNEEDMDNGSDHGDEVPCIRDENEHFRLRLALMKLISRNGGGD